MAESAAVPQFTVWRDLVLDRADARRGGLSWTTVLMRAYAQALREVPALLRRWGGDMAVDSGPPAVALAVDTPRGLLAPVLVEPDRAEPEQLDREVRALVRTAQSGRVDAGYLQTGNATLSNLGGMGVDRFQALVTPPQATVLAVGSVRDRPVAVPGGVLSALSVTVGLTVDHRVGDGADAARLLRAFTAAMHAD
jgi:pyruvate dehydrogenase E2 component (dihydrolipoamide acetyltransferase)